MIRRISGLIKKKKDVTNRIVIILSLSFFDNFVVNKLSLSKKIQYVIDFF